MEAENKLSLIQKYMVIKLNIIISQWLSQDFGLGKASNKIFSKVAKISVRSGDIQQKFTQR